jgi:polyisoprenoid-binding protein YceI
LRFKFLKAMKNKPAIFIVLLLLQFSAYAQQTYQLDIKKSKISWKLQTMGSHYGYLLFNSGSLNYSASGQPVTGTFSMDMNSIKSIDHSLEAANQKVDKELRTEAFFNIEKYPAATMVVKQIIPAGNATTYKIKGDLTIKGITSPIDFTAVINTKGNAITATGNLMIGRARWNIDHHPEPQNWDFLVNLKDKIIANDISISLNLVFNK